MLYWFMQAQQGSIYYTSGACWGTLRCLWLDWTVIEERARFNASLCCPV